MYLLFQTNTWETMKQSHPWQLLGAYLTCFTKIPKSAFQLSQEKKTRYQVQARKLWLMPPRQMLRDTRTSVLAVHLSSQPGQGRYGAPTATCLGGKPWKKFLQLLPCLLRYRNLGHAERDMLSQPREKGLFRCSVG